MDTFLETYSLLKLSQEETNNLNRPIARSEIESVKKTKTNKWKLPTNTSSGLHGLTGEFYQTYAEELLLILLKIFQKIEEDGTLPYSFYEATITLIEKPKTLKKKIIQANIFNE